MSRCQIAKRERHRYKSVGVWLSKERYDALCRIANDTDRLLSDVARHMVLHCLDEAPAEPLPETTTP